MRGKFDLHCHSRFSADGVSEPEEMVEAAKKAGLSGIAITDHNTCACVDYFLKKGLMREDGEPVDDFLIIPGQEISTAKGHLIALGIRLPGLKGIGPLEAADLIHEEKGLVIPPHPFDYFRAGIRKSFLDRMPIDAIEVFNAATTLKRCNNEAYAYAEEKKLPMLAGSDAHHVSAIGRSYTILEPDSFDLQGVLESVKRPVGMERRYLTAKDAFLKTWNNWFRIKRN